MKTYITVEDKQMDITAPKCVEVQTSHNRKVLWVNVDGVCRLRCCSIGEFFTNLSSQPLPTKIWKICWSKPPIGDAYYSTLDQVKASIALTYSGWMLKPTIETEREDYVAWRVPNGELVEAQAIDVLDRIEHL